MNQSKKQSLIESIYNTLVGFLITWIFSPGIYWICNVKVNYNQIGLLTLLFTILSIARNYVIRRWFNKKIKNNYESKTQNTNT